jgi:tetratricopeptide (TPR) repeat protein
VSGHADLALRESTFPGPLLGRRAQLGIARAALERVRGAQGQVLALVGEAGIGKSRLATEIHRLGRRQGFDVAAGACPAHGATDPYLVWHPIWRALLGLDDAMAVGEQEVRLTARITEHDNGSSQRAPLLGPAVNLSPPDSQLTASLDPPARSELLQSLLLEHLRAHAGKGPLLLVLEDCHWMDPASEGLLEFLARNITREPVLLLLTSRPEGRGPTVGPVAGLAHYTEVPLGQLPREAAEQLVAHRLGTLLGQQAVAGDLVRQLASLAGGNPLHLEELVSLFADDGAHAARAVADPDLVNDLRRLVAARTELLGEDERTTLEVASVLGTRFRADWIWGSYPQAGTADQVLRNLERLTELRLLRRHGAGQAAEYAFKHALVQDVVYQRLSPGRRELLHERIARYLEEANADRLTQLVDVLAHHYRMTSNVDKQRRWFRVAGVAAREAFATETAIAYYNELRPLLEPDQTGELLIELGDLLSLAARWDEAETAYRQALEVAESTGDRRVHAQATRGLGSVLPYASAAELAPRLAVERLRQAAMEFEQLDDRSGLARTLERLAWTSWGLGDYQGALAASERQLALATEAADPVGMSTALENMGVVRWLTGDHTQAVTLLEQALHTATRAGHRPGVILAANDLASVRSELGEHVVAIHHLKQALAVAEEIGDRRMAAVAIGNIGECHRRRGEYGLALRCLAHGFQMAAEIGDRSTMAGWADNLATTLAAQGHEGPAEQLLGRAIMLARHLRAQYWLSESLYQLARLLAATGRPRDAERVSREVLELSAAHQGGVELPARLLWLRLRVELGAIDRAAAVRELRDLRDTRIEPAEQAAILAAIWEVDETQEQAGREAASRYRALYEQAPIVEYREAYERLTGTRLPPAPPLPSIPDSVTGTFELAQVLAQLDLAIARTRAAGDPAV